MATDFANYDQTRELAKWLGKVSAAFAQWCSRRGADTDDCSFDDWLHLRSLGERLRTARRRRDEAIATLDSFTLHDGPDDCPLYYDRCWCSLETLAFNIERAETAERQRDHHRRSLLALIHQNQSGKYMAEASSTEPVLREREPQLFTKDGYDE